MFQLNAIEDFNQIDFVRSNALNILKNHFQILKAVAFINIIVT